MFEVFKRQQQEPVVHYAEGSHLPKKEAKKILPDVDEVFLDADPRPGELPVAITEHEEDGWITQVEHNERITKQEGYQQDFEDEEVVGGAETPEELERAEVNEMNYNSPESIEGQTLYDLQQEDEFTTTDAFEGGSESTDDRDEDKHETEVIESSFDREVDKYTVGRSLEKNQNDVHFYGYARGGNSKPVEKDYKGGERIVETLEV